MRVRFLAGTERHSHSRSPGGSASNRAVCTEYSLDRGKQTALQPPRSEPPYFLQQEVGLKMSSLSRAILNPMHAKVHLLFSEH